MPYHELRDIDVVVSKDQIVLSGDVPSFLMKQVVQETAKAVGGHRQVLKQIRVST